MTNKEQYAELCKVQHDIPLFMQYWWLEGVCAGKQWDVLLVKNDAGEIIAAMPYLLRQRFWMKYIIMPQQTQVGGLWIHPDVRDSMAGTQKICGEISAQLQGLKLAYYYQQYPLHSAAPEYMQALGFKAKKRVTYRIEDLTDIDKVIDSFSKNKKRQLQKALSLHADLTLDSESFYQFHTDCLQAQGKQISYTREFFLVMYQKALKHQCGQIIAIRNADEVLVAAAFLVWDKNSLYYLIPCYDPAYSDSGAGALLVLEAIKFARTKQLAFDFEGSMIRGVAQHYKQFGSTPTEYYSVHKYYNHFFAVALFINWLRNKINKIG